MEKTKTGSEFENPLEAENSDLRARLEAAEDILSAIRKHEVDALVVDQEGTEQICTLQGAEGAYRTFVEAMNQGAATLAADGTILYCNRQFSELLRAPFDQTVGMSIYDFITVEESGLLRAALWEGLTAPCTTRRFSLLSREGGKVAVVITATPATTDGVSCVCIVVTDLTESEARVAAEAESRAKDRFLAVLSHELRTPLNPVVMTVTAMESDSRLPADLREDLSMIRRNLELETRLIDDLLDLSRIQNGKVQLQWRPFSMRSLVEDVLKIVKNELHEKSIEVECEWTAESDRVNGDSTRVSQVIWNVVKNAVKFSKDQGKLIVRLLNDDAESVRLEVQDFGMGIDPRLLPRIFNAFEQGDSTLPSQGGGLGLGLTIARAIVEMHGGAMSARSDGIDQGATISVTLPLTSREVQLREVLKSAEGVDSDVSSMRVLLVEDHKDTAVVLGKHLEHCGHSVKIAGSVASALEAASAEPFDLIIADIGLPDGTGHDLMRQIKVRHTIPAIALTGYGMEDDLSRSREAGFAEHIVKPVDLSHLQSAIARVAGKKTVS